MSVAEVESYFDSLDYSKRQQPVEYSLIQSAAVKLLGPKFAMAWGISFNLESLKKKDGRYVSVGGEKMTYDELLMKLATQGSAAMREGIADPTKRVDIAKDIVTPARLARAFAKTTIKYLKKKPAAGTFTKFVDDANKNLAEGDTLLPQYLGFPNAYYGLGETDVNTYIKGMLYFNALFDKAIDKAVEKGWQRDEKGNVIVSTAATKQNKRSWKEALEDWVGFEGWKQNA